MRDVPLIFGSDEAAAGAPVDGHTTQVRATPNMRDVPLIFGSARLQSTSPPKGTPRRSGRPERCVTCP